MPERDACWARSGGRQVVEFRARWGNDDGWMELPIRWVRSQQGGPRAAAARESPPTIAGVWETHPPPFPLPTSPRGVVLMSGWRICTTPTVTGVALLLPPPALLPPPVLLLLPARPSPTGAVTFSSHPPAERRRRWCHCAALISSTPPTPPTSLFSSVMRSAGEDPRALDNTRI